MSDKIKYQAEADKTSFTIDLAHRLVNGLGSEAVRWHQSVDKYAVFLNYLDFKDHFVGMFWVERTINNILTTV